MTAQPEKYERLPGRGMRQIGKLPISFHHSRLWLGSDHLLLVNSTGWSEDYKRFYFRDIQAFVLRQSTRRRNWNLFFAGLAALFAIPVPFIEDFGVSLFFGILCLIPLLALILNSIRGATCDCYILTAVQNELLPSLGRLRLAQKVIALVEPLIIEAQGSISSEEIAARVEALPPVQPAPEGAASRARDRSTIRYSGRAHAVLFVTLLIESARATIDFFNRSSGITLLAIITGGTVAIAVIVALVKQQDAILPVALHRWTWGTLGFVAALSINGAAHYFAVVLQNPEIAHSDRAILQLYVQLSPVESPWVMGELLFTILGSALFGAVGLLLVRRHRKKWKEPPPLISLDQAPPLSHP